MRLDGVKKITIQEGFLHTELVSVRTWHNSGMRKECAQK